MISVRENKDMSLSLDLGGGQVKEFKSEDNFEVSKDLLIEFNNLETDCGKPLYSAFEVDNFYLLPAFQESLFWDFFVGVVNYREARRFIGQKEVSVFSEPKSVRRFGRIFSMTQKRYGWFTRIAFNIVAALLRRKSKAKTPILVYDDGEDGFRFKKFKALLEEHVEFSRVVHPDKSNLKLLWSGKSQFIVGARRLWQKKRLIKCDIKQSQLLMDYISQRELDSLLDRLHEKFLDWKREYTVLQKQIAQREVKAIFCYDQIERIVPLVMAAKRANVGLIGFQHGPFSHFHSGWIGYGIPSEFCNIRLDKIYTWGEFWRDFMGSISNKYSKDVLPIGAHLNKDMSDEAMLEIGSGPSSSQNLKILMPYEFLANFSDVSKFLEAFLDLGWAITIKIRPPGDGDAKEDRKAFSETVQQRAKFVQDLSDNELREFDVVVGTQSVYLAEMMKYGLTIWYLDTRVPFLKILVTHGIAHEIRMEHLELFKDEANVVPYLSPKYDAVKRSFVFTPRPLNQLVAEIVTRVSTL